MVLYDNLEDIKTKLVGTFCYYDGKACLVKAAQADATGKQFILTVTHISARTPILVPLDDPKFQYMKFNIGYTNHQHGCVWWYRIPQKQWRQGLKHDQVSFNHSSSAYAYGAEFGWNYPVVNMMEDKYPKWLEAEKMLKDGDREVMAFHRDVAAKWDGIHKDMILEYKGKQVGSMLSTDQIMLLDEHKHLTEAIKEALA